MMPRLLQWVLGNGHPVLSPCMSGQPAFAFVMVATVPWLAAGPEGGGGTVPRPGLSIPPLVGAALSQWPAQLPPLRGCKGCSA